MLSLFTKSYANDLPWLELALKSVAAFCTEPVDWTIVVERDSESATTELLGRFRLWKYDHLVAPKIITVESTWPEFMALPGYLRQQAIKLTAHRVMKGLFWSWDSDVIAQKSFTHRAFLADNGRPIYFFSDFNVLMNGGPDTPAHRTRQEMIKHVMMLTDAPFEWMRVMPMPMYAEILAHWERSDYWQRALASIASPGFSEFNLYGTFALHHFPDAYEWRNAETYGTWGGGYVEGGGNAPMDGVSLIHQAWSYGGVPANIATYINSLGSTKP